MTVAAPELGLGRIELTEPQSASPFCEVRGKCFSSEVLRLSETPEIREETEVSLDNSRKQNFDTTDLPSLCGQSPDLGPTGSALLQLTSWPFRLLGKVSRACPWSVESSESP